MTTVHLYVLNTMADWEWGYLTSELNSGRFFKDPANPMPVRTVGATLEPVRTIGGVQIVPELTVDQISPAESGLLLLPGGDTWLEPAQRPILAKAKEFLAAGVPVAAICGATMGLASAGILDDRPHTSNDLYPLQQFVPTYRGEQHYVNAPAVTDGDLITATGVAPLQFAREVLARLDVMSPAALEAWYQLNNTHEGRYFFELMEAVPQPVS